MEKIKAFFPFAYQVVSALGAIACILVWVGIRPKEISNMTWPRWIWLIIGLVLFAMSLYSSRRAWKPPKLIIHSALYGTGPSDDDDITQGLRKIATDALVIDVTNTALGRLRGIDNYDPALGKVKRLEVEYSYASSKKLVATRPEGARLVIPEDFWMKAEMQKKDDLIRRLAVSSGGGYVAAEARAGKAGLEVRFSETAPYQFKESSGDITHYRMGIYNDSSVAAENVEVLLVSIEPGPAAPLFAADFPYKVRRAFSPVAKLEGCSINPKNQELFELLSFWTGSDGQLYVDGIDTKREPGESRYSRFPMEPSEKWRLKYKITSANADEQMVVFSAHQERQKVILVLD